MSLHFISFYLKRLNVLHYALQSIILDKLALLVGDYHSDSDNEDSDQRQKMSNGVTTGEPS